MSQQERVRNPRIVRVMIALVVGLSPAAAQTRVWVVDDNGPAHFTDIQLAVTAALDGDVVLVRPSLYAYPAFALQGKSLSIVAEAGSAPFVYNPLSYGAAVSVSNLPAGGYAVLSGMNVGGGEAGAGIMFSGSEGVLLAMDMFARGGSSMYSNPGPGLGVHLKHTAPAFFSGCTVWGGPGWTADFYYPWAGDGNTGLVSASDLLGLYDTTVLGGVGGGAFYGGQGGNAGDSLSSQHGRIFVSGGLVQGGQGGAGGDPHAGQALPAGCGGSGGNGLELLQGALCESLDGSILGGVGGAPGKGGTCMGPGGVATVLSSGTLVALPFGTRRFDADRIVREGSLLSMTFQGKPGDQVFYLLTDKLDPRRSRHLNGVAMPSIADSRYIRLDAIPASGSLSVVRALPPLPPGDEGKLWHLQALFRDVAGNLVLGDYRAVVLVDDTF